MLTFFGAQIVVNSSDRGLCGGINSGVAKNARIQANELTAAGEKVAFAMIGDKARGQLNRTHGSLFEESFDEHNKQPVTFSTVLAVVDRLSKVRAYAAGVVRSNVSRFVRSASWLVCRGFPLLRISCTHGGAGLGCIFDKASHTH